MLRAGVALLACAVGASAQFESSSWISSVNTYRCQHDDYVDLQWDQFLVDQATAAAATHSLCGAVTQNVNILEDNTAATHPTDTTRTYYGFTYMVGIHSASTPGATAEDMVDTWYQQGYPACTTNNNTMPGCSDKTTVNVGVLVDNDDSTTDDDNTADVTLPFIQMMSANARYMGCYQCPNVLRSICTIKGSDDSCVDCASCNAIGQSQCNDIYVPDVNASKTRANCKVITLSLADTPAEPAGDNDDGLGDWAIAGIVLLSLLLVVVAVAGFRHRNLIKRNMAIGYDSKFTKGESKAGLVAMARKNTHMHMVERAKTINHSASSKIMNPHIDVLPTTGGGGELPSEQKSAAEHLSAEDFLRVALRETKAQKNTEVRQRVTTSAGSNSKAVRFSMGAGEGGAASAIIGESTL